MLIEELQSRAGIPLPRFDAAAHAELYRALPRDLRRVVNALVRAGGTLPMDELLRVASSSTDAARKLDEHGLITLLPRKEGGILAVLPYERLFATPLIENDPDKLVEALKVYSRDLLWTLASVNAIAVDGAGEVELRARLFRRAVQGGTLSDLPMDVYRVLELLKQEDWILPGDQVFEELNLDPPRGGRNAESLFEAFAGDAGLGEALRRMLVVPVREMSGRSFYVDLAVPAELRDRIAALPRPSKGGKPASKSPGRPKLEATACPSCARKSRWSFESREGRLPGELLRFLLLAEQEPISLTQAGQLNQRDLSRLAKVGGLDKTQVTQIVGIAGIVDAFRFGPQGSRPGPQAARLVALDLLGLAMEVRKKSLDLAAHQLRPWSDKPNSRTEAHEILEALDARLEERPEGFCLSCFRDDLVSGQAGVPRLRAAKEWERERAAEMVLTFIVQYHLAGLLDLSRHEGYTESIRATDTARAMLEGRAGTPLAPAEDPITLQPTGEILAPRTLPLDQLLRLARCCDIKSVDAVAVFALNRKSLQRAAARGEDLSALRMLLESSTRRPLPQTVSVLLDEFLARTGEFVIHPCSAVIRLKDPAMIRDLGPAAIPLADGWVILPEGEDPEELERSLRKKGHLPLLKRTGPEAHSDHLERLRPLLDDARRRHRRVHLFLKDGSEYLGTVVTLHDDALALADEEVPSIIPIPFADLHKVLFL